MAGLVNLLSNVFQAPSGVNSLGAVVQQPSGNYYGNNPFVSYDSAKYSSRFYAQNKPVKGGYFAGYYNGKPNIVGRKLFIEA